MMTSQPTKKNNSALLIIVGVIAGICVLCVLGMFALSAMGLLTGSTTSIPLSVATSAPTSIPPTDIPPSINARCVAASQLQTENIRSGIKDIQQSNDVSNGWAVKSNDFENVWFVAAQITGPNIAPNQAIGVWAISGDPASPGLTYSVNSFAIEFSSWPDGSTTDAQTSMSDDGAQQAYDCAVLP